MGKASSTKKVARAARAGGGSTRAGRSARSYFWPGFISVVVVLGTLGVVVSRSEKRSAAAPMSAPSRDSSPPRASVDHWHAAYGVDICGKFLSPVSDQTDPIGIHTHGDGVIHVHPFRLKGRANSFSGKNANLRAFLRSVGGQISDKEIQVPGHKAKRNGMKCNGKPGQVQVVTWNKGDPVDQGTTVTGNPGDLRLLDHMLVTVAFVPKGTKIAQPTSAPQLDRLTDVASASSTTIPGDPAAPPSLPPPAGAPSDAPPSGTAATPPSPEPGQSSTAP